MCICMMNSRNYTIVKPNMIETYNLVCPTKMIDHFLNLVFNIHMELLIRVIPNNSNRHTHVFNITPAANFICRILGFQVKIEDVFHEKFFIDCLLKNGISSDRITTEDLGSDQPASKGTTMFSMAKNRRVEFIIIK